MYRDASTWPPNLVNFGPETAKNGWRDFAHPAKFSHWETLPALPHGRYMTDSRRTLARVMYIVARAYGLKQQNAGRAYAVLCHASSFLLQWAV